jgi:hypothetical protein
MSHVTRRIALTMLALTGIGCGDALSPSTAPDSGPFGPAETSALLAPFAGDWEIDFEKTLEGYKAAGWSDEAIQRTREMRVASPKHFKVTFPDLSFNGNIAIGDTSTPLIQEYRFFAMHEHDGKVCGKAWHHEDRFDPGDMSKRRVRLWIRDEQLYLEVKMWNPSVELNDPDFSAMSPPDGGSVADCVAEDLSSDWTEWLTYVYSRKQ